MKVIRRFEGYLLLEGLLAVLLIAVGLAPLLSSMMAQERIITDSKLQSLALSVCEANLETLRFKWANGVLANSGTDWMWGTMPADVDGNFIASYQIATFSDFPFPPPNNVATLYRVDLEVMWLPGWQNFNPPLPDAGFEAYRDPLVPSVWLTTFWGKPGQ